eukprot:3741575-Amphidinium_carterae.1
MVDIESTEITTCAFAGVKSLKHWIAKQVELKCGAGVQVFTLGRLLALPDWIGVVFVFPEEDTVSGHL